MVRAGMAGFLLLLMASCLFGPSRGPRVLGYRHGSVLFTSGGYYRVGTLPAGWRAQRPRARSVSFRDASTGAVITTSAFCGASFEDLPLPGLMGHLFTGIPSHQVAAPESMMLNDRGALRQRSVRSVDGVRLLFDAVIVKKDGCSFDFFSVASPEGADAVRAAFEDFFRGFDYSPARGASGAR